METGQVDTLWVDVKARADEASFRDVERQADAAGDRAGQTFGGKFAGGLKGAATLAAGGVAVLAGAAIAAAPALQEMAGEAAKAEATTTMFQKTLERFNVPADSAAKAVEDLSQRLGVAPTVIQEGMTTILRAGGTLEDATRTIEAAGASAAAAGTDIGSAVENASVAIATGRSELLETAGIITNASDAYKDYAKSIGVKTDALTEAQKIEAFSKAIHKESKYEIADLSVIMNGYAGDVARNAQAQREFRQVIGQLVLPVVSALTGVVTDAARGATVFLKSFQGSGELKNMAGQVQNFAQSLATQFGPTVRQAGELFKSVFQTMGPFVVQTFNTIRPVIQSFGPLFSSVVNIIVTLWNTVLRPSIQGWLPVVSAVFSGVAGAVRGAVQIVTGVLNALSALLKGDVSGAARIMQQAFSGAVQSVIAGAQSMGRGILTALGNIPGQVAGIARDIVAGLVNGIQNGVGAVGRAAMNLGSNLLSSIKSTLKIQSPSREMEQVGIYAGEGLVVGLNKTAPSVQKAAALLGSKVYQGVVDALGQGMAEIQNAADQATIVKALFGDGLGGLNTALDRYGVKSFEELEKRAPSAARVIGAAYADIIQSGETALAAVVSANEAAADANEKLISDEASLREKTAKETADAILKINEDAADENEDLIKEQWDAQQKTAEETLKTILAVNDAAAADNEDTINQMVKNLEEARQLAEEVAGLVSQRDDTVGYNQPIGESTPSRSDPFGMSPEESRAAAEALKTYIDSIGEMTAAQLDAVEADRLLMQVQEVANAVTARRAGLIKEQEQASKDLAASIIAVGEAGAAESEQDVLALVEAQKTLKEVQKEVAKASGETERPWQAQIDKLEALRGTIDAESIPALNALIGKLRELDAAAAKTQGQEKAVASINKWGNYAKQLIPVVTGAMQALGGTTSEVAAQWGEDLGNMVNDVVNFGTAIAKGDYLGAAIQALTTIFNWFTRNKKAAEEAAKATKEYNDQFKFTADGYNTRSVEKYTTGFLFWTTDHYKETVDQAAKSLALALEGGFISGIENGFNAALEANDFSKFEENLQKSVGQAVLKGLIESFMQQELLKNTIGPAIQQYLVDGNAEALRNAVRGATAQAQTFYDTVLKPIASDFGLLGQSTSAPAGSIAAMQEQIQKLQSALNIATNQQERDRLQGEIDAKQRQLDAMKGKLDSTDPSRGLQPISSTEVSAPKLQSLAQASVSTTIDLSALTGLSSTLTTLTPQLLDSGRLHLQAAQMQLEAASRLSSASTNWATLNRQ